MIISNLIILIFDLLPLQILCDSYENYEKCQPEINVGCGRFFDEDYPSPLKADHQCQDYIKQDRGDETNTLSILSKFKNQDIQIAGEVHTRRRYNLFYANGTKPGQEFIICAMPKNGVSRTKSLLTRINRKEGKCINCHRYPNIQEMKPLRRMQILLNKDIPRIKIVRNPYIRAISMYLDKIRNTKMSKGVYKSHGLKFKNQPSFDDFVNELYKRWMERKHVDHHFTPQYEFCWENLGLKFDYTVKTERMNYWYPCFIENLNLWQYVMQGWPTEKHCYFSSKDVPCNGPVQMEDGRLVFNLGQTDGVAKNHNHDSALKLQTYYANKETVQKVTQIFLVDIVHYNYPFFNEFSKNQTVL